MVRMYRVRMWGVAEVVLCGTLEVSDWKTYASATLNKNSTPQDAIVQKNRGHQGFVAYTALLALRWDRIRSDEVPAAVVASARDGLKKIIKDEPTADLDWWQVDVEEEIVSESPVSDSQRKVSSSWGLMDFIKLAIVVILLLNMARWWFGF